MPPKPLQHPNRRRVLIYAGMAAVALLVLLMRRSASASDPTAQQPTAQPVSNPAVDPASYYTGGTGAGGVDYGPQLATLDTDVQTLAQAVAAGQSAAQTPGTTTPGTGGTDTAGLITAIVGAVSAGAAIAAPKQPGPGNTPAAKPSTRPPAPKLTAGEIRAPFGHNKPPAKKGYTIVGQGSGYWAYKPVARGPGNRK